MRMSILPIFRSLYGWDASPKLTRSITGGLRRWRMVRLARIACALIVLLAVGYFALVWMRSEPMPQQIEEPTFAPTPLPESQAFPDLAQRSPVRMLEACLSRYSREVKGFRATLVKKERVGEGEHAREVIRVCVAGEAPEEATAEKEKAKVKVKVRMIWDEGFQLDLTGNAVRSTLFCDGENDGNIFVWRPDALVYKEWTIAYKGSKAREASRFCIRDTGIYHGMLRTHAAWERASKEGKFHFEYLGQKSIEEVGGRNCHVIRRTCVSPELDAFALDEQPPTDAKSIAREGFSSVVIMVDAEHWLQVGTEVYRADGSKIAYYYYRDIELNPSFAPDTFTRAGFKTMK